jgi:hypothetical protein
MMTVKHSPLPWKLEGPSRTPRADTTGDFAIIAGGQIIGETFRQTGPTAFQPADANAALIVRAVNAHEDLVEACAVATAALHITILDLERRGNLAAAKEMRDVMGPVDAALAKAGVKP